MRKHQKFTLDRGGSIKKVRPKNKTSTYERTLELYKNGKDVVEIAKTRGYVESTIITHLERLKSQSKLSPDELKRIIPKNLSKDLAKIHKTFEETGGEKLSPVFNKFNGKYSYHELRLARLML